MTENGTKNENKAKFYHDYLLSSFSIISRKEVEKYINLKISVDKKQSMCYFKINNSNHYYLILNLLTLT